MNRKELLSKLREFTPNTLIRAHYCGLIVAIDRVESYRGSYDSISLSIDEKNFKNYYTVENLIKDLEETNTLHGYKGGEYGVNEEAHIYVSPYGYSSNQYVDEVRNLNGFCELMTID